MPETTLDHEVIIAGGGPTGLMLAGELKLAGIDVLVVERRAGQEMNGARAGGLHSRTLEVLDQRGIVDRFLAQGQRHPGVHFHVPLAIDDFPTRHNCVLGLWQGHTERLLADWVDELGVPTRRACAVADFAQDTTGVTVTLADGRALRAAYLVGCDGGRSKVRKAAGIDFPGCDPTLSWIIAEVEMSEEPRWGFRHTTTGTHAIGRVDDTGMVRVVLTEAQLHLDKAPSLRDVRTALGAVYGSDFGIRRAGWISRFTDMTRQAAAYRDRRVLLAGDAAHVHPPMGGQGLNLGVQDAVNLGWKLAQVVRQTSPASLLDMYHSERHPVASRLLRNSLSQVALRRPDERSRALGETVAAFLAMEEPRRRMAAEMSGLGIHYELGAGHPLLGHRMPDVDLNLGGGPCRVFELLHEARAVLLNLGQPGGFDLTPWGGRIVAIDASYGGPWTLPVIGPVAAPAALLIRPDGYVAWVGDGTWAGLAAALSRWCGPPAMVTVRPA